MTDITKQIEKVQKKTIGYELELHCETNKYGYNTLALYLNESRLCSLNTLSNFEKNYIINRLNNICIDKETRTYKDESYEVIVIKEHDGYENESIVLKLSYESKTMLLAILNANGVL